jgi:hypothetical protein
MAVGVNGLVEHTDATPPSSYLRFLIGGDILHDLVVAPMTIFIGVLILRRVPAVVHPPLRAGLFASAIVITLSWPALRGYGRERAPDNPTVQPLNYATALLTVLAAIWLISLAWFLISLWAEHRRRAHRNPSNEPYPNV